MALPSTGAISFNNVNQELGKASPYNQTITMNDSDVRTLFGKASGAIAMSDGWGKSNTKIEATGGTVYTNGDYKIHIFASTATFSVTKLTDTSMLAEAFCVGGGESGIGGEERDCNYNGGNGGSGGNGGMRKKYLSYNFANLLRSTTGDITITVGAAGDSHTGFTGQGGGSYYSDNAPSQSNGGAGGLGGNTSIYGYNGTPGANGVDGDFVSWTGSNIYAGGGGGGGGGGAYNVYGSDYGGGGGNGGNGGGGNGGAGANASGGNQSSGGNGDNAGTYGGGGGGGGGACGEPNCDKINSGGDGGLGSSGVVIIRYKFR